MSIKRSATSVWTGNAMQGKGAITTQSGAFSSQPYSFNTRFQSEDGRAGTNPEELLAAAHSGCFAMATSFALSSAGHPPDELKVNATVQLDRQGEAFTVTGIHLDLEARVPGIDDAGFQAAAKGAKENCPLSKALAAVPITLSAKLL